MFLRYAFGTASVTIAAVQVIALLGRTVTTEMYFNSSTAYFSFSDIWISVSKTNVLVPVYLPVTTVREAGVVGEEW